MDDMKKMPSGDEMKRKHEATMAECDRVRREHMQRMHGGKGEKAKE